MRVFAQTSTESFGGLWVSPDWEVYDIKEKSHVNFANEDLNSEPAILENEGWIRVTWKSGQAYIEGENIDESKFKNILKIMKRYIGDLGNINYWEIYQSSNFKRMEATKDDVEDYGDIWRALIRGRMLRQAIIRFANKILTEE